MVIKRYIHTRQRKLLGFSDFIPANSAADWTTGEDWGSGGGVCLWGGGVWGG